MKDREKKEKGWSEVTESLSSPCSGTRTETAIDSIQLKDVFLEDHEYIAGQVEKISRARKNRLRYFHELVIFVIAHIDAEEVCLFKNTSIDSNPQKLKRRMVASHEIIRKQIQTLLDTYEDDDLWSARFEVLEHNIFSHLKDEESMVFRALADSTDGIDIEEIRCIYLKEMEMRKTIAKDLLMTGVILSDKDKGESGVIARKIMMELYGDE